MTDSKARAGRWAALETAFATLGASLLARYLAGFVSLTLAERTALDSAIFNLLPILIEGAGYVVGPVYAWVRGYWRVWWAPANAEDA